MKKHQILRTSNKRVKYSEETWNLLNRKRSNAKKLLEIFVREGFNPFIYGSIARGDVHIDSDIDIVFPRIISPYKLEYILFTNGYKNLFREIIMATPSDSLKLYIHLSELESITVPLSKLGKTALEFYDFGGKINYKQLQDNTRISGINKRLVLITPLPNGHIESSIIGNEHVVAKQLKLSIDTILERKRVLLKREHYGKTGVFIKRELGFGESTEEALRRLAKSKSIVRKKIRDI